MRPSRSRGEVETPVSAPLPSVVPPPAGRPLGRLHRLGLRLGRLPAPTLALLGYGMYVAVGTLLLMAGVSQSDEPVSFLDNLFTATSAVSTTGLTTISVADRYSFLGQLVVLVLIQLGGLGYMTVSSCVILSRRPDLPPGREQVGRAVFSLPASFELVPFLRAVAAFTLVIEVAGAVALYPILRARGLDDPIWSALFHSVSAFCTAGFSLYNDSFMAFRGHAGANLVLALLSYLGAIGFIVCLDAWRVVVGRARSMTITSRIILVTTFWVSALATGFLFVAEPSLAGLPPEERLLAAGFQAMTASTTVGFNTVGIGELSHASLLVLVILMIIGASPSGTGGGLKSTTFTALLGVMAGALRGEREVRFWGHAIPLERIWTAMASLGFYLAAFAAGALALEAIEARFAFEDVVFEVASALGTVGLSCGITGDLSALGKLVVVALMFLGRVGPLTFGIALFARGPVPPADEERPDLAI